jgi:hypothetical protein
MQIAITLYPPYTRRRSALAVKVNEEKRLLFCWINTQGYEPAENVWASHNIEIPNQQYTQMILYKTALYIDYSQSRMQTSKSQGFAQWCNGIYACIQKTVMYQPTIRVNINTGYTV